MKQSSENSYNFCLIGAATSVGRVRKANEDSMVIFETANMKVFVVCDGMGGHVGGQVASQTAVAAIKEFMTGAIFTDPREAIYSSIMAANEAILRQAKLQPELAGMGSTCVMLIVTGDGKVYYGHVGDSRIYIVASRRITQLTRDHSFVQMLVDSGQISKDQADNHPRKNEITNALGLLAMQPPTLSGTVIEPDAGNCFLLCSDGLTGMVDDAQIERVVSNRKFRIQERAEKLVQMANDNGGVDNITVQLIEFALGTQDLKKDTGNRGFSRKKIYPAITILLLVFGVALIWTWISQPSFIFRQKSESISDTTDNRTNEVAKQWKTFLTTPLSFTGTGVPVIAEILNFPDNDSLFMAGQSNFPEIEKIQGRYITIKFLKIPKEDTLFVPCKAKLSGDCLLRIPIRNRPAGKSQNIPKSRIEIRFDSITFMKRVTIKIPEKYKDVRLQKGETLPTNHPDVKCDVLDEKYFMVEIKTAEYPNPLIISWNTTKGIYLFIIPVRKLQEFREQI